MCGIHKSRFESRQCISDNWVVVCATIVQLFVNDCIYIRVSSTWSIHVRVHAYGGNYYSGYRKQELSNVFLKRRKIFKVSLWSIHLQISVTNPHTVIVINLLSECKHVPRIRGYTRRYLDWYLEQLATTVTSIPGLPNNL